MIAQLPPPDDQKDAELAVEVGDRTGDEEGVWVRDLSETGEVKLPAGLRERLGLDGSSVQLEFALGEDGGVELRALLDDQADAYHYLLSAPLKVLPLVNLPSSECHTKRGSKTCYRKPKDEKPPL